MGQSAALQTRIREALGSKPGRNTNDPDCGLSLFVLSSLRQTGTERRWASIAFLQNLWTCFCKQINEKQDITVSMNRFILHAGAYPKISGVIFKKIAVSILQRKTWIYTPNPLNPELNPICYLLALLGAHHFLHVSRIRVKPLILRLLMSYIYGAPILDVSRSHTTTQHSR